jgi:hypothetical protein
MPPLRRRDNRRRAHNIRAAGQYAGVLAPSIKWRSRIAPKHERRRPDDAGYDSGQAHHREGAGYRAWGQLLKRTFDIDMLQCPRRQR